MIKIATVVGARPQFIKAATISRAIRSAYADRVIEHLIHTGQHYDENMSQVFFDELEIPAPKYNLGVSGGTHGSMTGRMLQEIERVLQSDSPDWVLIYGDTNSTLAAALAAAKLHIPIVHVEAGIRSFNMRMPEEINRIVADRVSTLLCCPTKQATMNLAAEGIRNGVHHVGDVMFDIALHVAEKSKRIDVTKKFGVRPKQFILATCHRPENTDSRERLTEIARAFASIAKSMPIVFPIHPRSKAKMADYGLLEGLRNILMIEPVSYLEMAALQRNAQAIVTDSGGMQKEAFFYEVPCITLRPDTEWPETVEAGGNVLVDADASQIVEEVENSGRRPRGAIRSADIFGAGDAAFRTLELILQRASA